jgi:hypothetical protein
MQLLMRATIAASAAAPLLGLKHGLITYNIYPLSSTRQAHILLWMSIWSAAGKKQRENKSQEQTYSYRLQSLGCGSTRLFSTVDLTQAWQEVWARRNQTYIPAPAFTAAAGAAGAADTREKNDIFEPDPSRGCCPNKCAAGIHIPRISR